jgi:hypothetical protein
MNVVNERLMVSGALEGLLADIDDYCGTPPRPHIPWLRDVLVGVAVARLAGTLEESNIRGEFQKLSSQLVKGAFQRAGSDPMPGLALKGGRG